MSCEDLFKWDPICFSRTPPWCPVASVLHWNDSTLCRTSEPHQHFVPIIAHGKCYSPNNNSISAGASFCFVCLNGSHINNERTKQPEMKVKSHCGVIWEYVKKMHAKLDQKFLANALFRVQSWNCFSEHRKKERSVIRDDKNTNIYFLQDWIYLSGVLCWILASENTL